MEVTMKSEMSKLLFTTAILGLVSGGVLAHEQQYDNSKEPHESPHKATPPTGGHSSLASAATNPIANLIQFQVQNQYTPDNNNAGTPPTTIMRAVPPTPSSCSR
jgi:hypothetical protein